MIGLVALLAGGPARAQEHAVDDPDTEAARRHFAEGSALYDEHRYPEAMRAFEAARALRPLPSFDYNIARCLDRTEAWGAAADAYDRYLKEVSPTELPAQERADLERRVQLLRERAAPHAVPPVEQAERAAERAAVTPAPPPIAAPAPAHKSVLRPLAITGLSLAVAAAGAGTGLVLWVNSDFPGKQAECRQRQCTSPDWSGLETRANAGYALWAVGGGLAVVDAVLWALDARSRRADAARRVWLAPSGRGVLLGGSF